MPAADAFRNKRESANRTKYEGWEVTYSVMRAHLEGDAAIHAIGHAWDVSA